ncbi:UNVERIFIED_ORG: hypothetical protein E4P37_17945 [Bacillus sp. AZ43]
MTQPNLQPPIKQVYTGARASARLRQMGLTVEIFTEAALRGDEGRQQCTALHPLQSRGHRMWSDTTAGLRQGCLGLAEGWAIDRTGNFETVTHVDRGLAIAVAGGDEFTGWVGPQEPRVRRKRGPMTTRRVHDNYLGMEPLFSIGGATARVGAETWFFLIRATDESLWLELSKPIGHDLSGLVSSWSERIILPELAVSGGVTPIADEDEDGDAFSVTKK